MSKLFPMFKRRGKNKEEELEEESKKRLGKVNKHLKAHLHSPSHEVAPDLTKPIKKRKAKEGKRKAPIPGGKENNPGTFRLETQLTGDFYVDDCGVVRPCLTGVSELQHQEGFIVDDSGVVIPSLPVEMAVDSILPTEENNVIGKDDPLEITNMPEISCITNEFASSEGNTMEEAGFPEVNAVDNASDGCSSSHEEGISTCEQDQDESTMSDHEERNLDVADDVIPVLCDASEINEVTLSECDKYAPQDAPQGNVVSCIANDVSTIIIPEGIRTSVDDVIEIDDTLLPQDEEAVDEVMVDYSQRSDDDGGMNNYSSRNTDNEGGESTEDTNEDECLRGSIEVQHGTVAQFESKHEVKETQEGTVSGENSDMDVSGVHYSQESDDDFDSAQEEWDEDDFPSESVPGNTTEEGRSSVCDTVKGMSPGCIESVELNCSEESHVFAEEVNEATNSVLISSKGEEEAQSIVREASISSSYHDAPFDLAELKVTDISSVVDATNEEMLRDLSGQDDKKIPRSINKLARKTSNISTASSDMFDEELDELLDEELDRLSEEEVDGINQKVSLVEGVDTGTVEIAKDTINNCLQKDESTVEASKSKETELEKGTVLTTDVGINIVDQDGEISKICESGSDNISPTIEGSVNNTSHDSDCLTTIPEDDGCPEKGVKSKSSTSVSVEEGVDQAKDSGYYSLPVSPKPGVTVRANEAPDGGVDLNVVDDSFGDSEEEGMITPPIAVPSLLDQSATPTQKIPEIRECILDSSVTNESNVLYESCCENPEPETESVHTHTEAPESTEKHNEEASAESQKNKKPKNPKLYIGKDAAGTAELKEGSGSPRGGSTPTRHSRHKSPMLECENKQPSDERVLSPDPVGDRFLEQAVFVSHEEAEARLAQRRAARAEARELRLRELEKQQQDQENDEEKQFGTPSYAEPSPRSGGTGRTSVRTAGINCTGQYSRRSSEDSTTDESLPANVREMRAELKELDEKFRKAMITNAQLDNEKATLTFEVELMKDKYTELEETHTQLAKEHRKKCTEYEQLRKVSTKLQEEVKILRGMLQERDQLIQEYGLVVVGEEEENGEEVESEKEEVEDLSPRNIFVKKALISQEAAELLAKGAAKGSLDVRLKKLGEEKNDLEDQVRRLKLELEEEQIKNRRRENGLDYEKQKEQSKTVNEYKFRVQKAEAEVSTLLANDIGESDPRGGLLRWRATFLSDTDKVARLDALSTRYRTQSEELEKSEEELKLEKRKLQRELRDAQSRLEEVETTNNHLIKRFDKLKNARSTLLKDLSQDPA
nr:uncharacterized protein LOC123745541 isoform X2 [Procambarus clarkii]